MIPNSVTNVGPFAFYGCEGLTSVQMPKSVNFIGAYAFSLCRNVREVFFHGDAPAFGEHVFQNFGNCPTLYYHPETLEWGPSFDECSTTKLLSSDPLILHEIPRFGIQDGVFTFALSWTNSTPVVVEATVDPVNTSWVPISTNTLVNGSARFSDPQWKDHPARFYRLRSQ